MELHHPPESPLPCRLDNLRRPKLASCITPAKKTNKKYDLTSREAAELTLNRPSNTLQSSLRSGQRDHYKQGRALNLQRCRHVVISGCQRPFAFGNNWRLDLERARQTGNTLREPQCPGGKCQARRELLRTGLAAFVFSSRPVALLLTALGT